MILKYFNKILKFIILIYYEFVLFFFGLFQVVGFIFYWFATSKNLIDECGQLQRKIELKKKRYK